MPIYAVPKPHLTNLQLIMDQSYGKYSLNSMITHKKVMGFPLDNITHFSEMLMDLERQEPQVEKVIWKSDIAEAYWILPMHPCWQIKQVNRVDKYFVNCCNSFGGSGAPGIFIPFNSLVTWITQEIKWICCLSNYVNDSSGCGWKDNCLFYELYWKLLPKDQVMLLDLWEKLGIPHQLNKQLHSSPLPIISINVDTNELSLSLSDESKETLIAELQ